MKGYKILLGFIFSIMVIWAIVIWPYTRISEEIRFRKQTKRKSNVDTLDY